MGWIGSPIAPQKAGFFWFVAGFGPLSTHNQTLEGDASAPFGRQARPRVETQRAGLAGWLVCILSSNLANYL